MKLQVWLHDWIAPLFGWMTVAERTRMEKGDEAQIDAWIAEREMHDFNEDTCLPGDPPWFDVCEAVGDGHRHFLPRSVLPQEPSQ